MEHRSDYEDLKKSVANYFSALSEIFPKLESIEREATILADKLHDHLEQAAICQRWVKRFLLQLITSIVLSVFPLNRKSFQFFCNIYYELNISYSYFQTDVMILLKIF